jgi:hypothetical protein
VGHGAHQFIHTALNDPEHPYRLAPYIHRADIGEHEHAALALFTADARSMRVSWALKNRPSTGWSTLAKGQAKPSCHSHTPAIPVLPAVQASPDDNGRSSCGTN